LRYLVRLKYNGSEFNGWQIQPVSPSVQETLEKKLSMLLGEDIKVVGCGRTDTGVHANDFYMHFDFNNKELNTENLKYKLNSVVSNSIVITEFRKVSEAFHARFGATSRQYKYYITLVKNPFNQNMWWVRQPLNIDAMIEAGSYIKMYQDFTSFSKSRTDVKTNLCDVTQVELKQSGNDIVITIAANRFLRNMVRAIVGTLVEIGLGKRAPEDMKRVIEAEARMEAGSSAPAQGLFLNEIKYPEELIKAID
jgi:tRNA pseudouridine38-40 synthase